MPSPDDPPPLLLRVLRGRAVDADRDRLLDFVRQHAISEALQLPGLVSFQPALRQVGDGLEVVVVSAWQGYDDLAAVNRPITSPMPLSTAEGLITDARIDHYELVLGGSRMLPLNRAYLRISEATLKPHSAAPYFDRVRRATDSLLDTAGMVAFMIGRRVEERDDRVLSVSLWDTPESLHALTEPQPTGKMVVGDRDLYEFFAAPPVVDHYDALIAIDPEPDAPAVLVADDDARYVHATPAASQLIGWSIARLLTMRVSDIATSAIHAAVPGMWSDFVRDGTSVGQFDVRCPDGSSLPVNFSARTNTPWPGCHVSVLTAHDERPILDIDIALVQAGLIARYEQLPQTFVLADTTV